MLWNDLLAKGAITQEEYDKANLGFIGVKLDRGQHFVWMEYQPWLPTIGLLIVLSGWIFTFAQIIFYRDSSQGLVKDYS